MSLSVWRERVLGSLSYHQMCNCYEWFSTSSYRKKALNGKWDRCRYSRRETKSQWDVTWKQMFNTKIFTFDEFADWCGLCTSQGVMGIRSKGMCEQKAEVLLMERKEGDIFMGFWNKRGAFRQERSYCKLKLHYVGGALCHFPSGGEFLPVPLVAMLYSLDVKIQLIQPLTW